MTIAEKKSTTFGTFQNDKPEPKVSDEDKAAAEAKKQREADEAARVKLQKEVDEAEADVARKRTELEEVKGRLASDPDTEAARERARQEAAERRGNTSVIR